MTKATLIAGTLATTVALPAVAGGVLEPIMDAGVIIQQVARPSSDTAMPPVIIFALLVAVASASK